MKTKLLLLLVASCGTLTAQTSSPHWDTPKPGVKEVQVPLASLKPSATFKVGGTADWVLLTDDAVWITTTKPYSLRRIDPATNKIIATVRLSGEACSGLESGFGSIWAPVCGKKPALVRVDARTNKISAVLPIAPAGREGGITASGDSIWMVTDKKGTLTRIDPSTNSARQRITIPLGSYNPLFSDGIVWITGAESNVLVPVDASTGGVLASIPVGSTPRFLTAGGGSVWTLNQGDGTVSRVDTSTKKVTATIKAGIPGLGGDLCYGADSVWATVFDVPLTRIDAKTDDVLRQWVGKGGDSVRVGFGSIWLTDYYRGLLWRIDVHAPEASNGKPSASEKQQVTKLGTQNPEAYELYLKGRSYWSKRTLPNLETAVSYFNQAIAKDPGYALAYSALADAYAVLPDYGGSPIEDIPKSNAAARKALELDPTLARPHAAMGYTKFRHEWDFAGAEAEFKKALALDPDDALTHAWYAENIGTIGGREQEALAEVNLAHQLDPLSPVISYDLGNIHILARRYDEGIAACKKLADENPTFAMAHYCLSDAYWGKQKYSESIEEYKAGSQLSGDRNDFEYAFAMEQGFRSAGWKGALRKGIEVSVAQHKTTYSSSYTIATMHAQLGEKDQAFQWLDTALQEHDQSLIGLQTDYTLDSVRSDPRFAELVRKVGLPLEEKRVTKQGTQNPEAYALYVKGRSYWEKQTRADLETAVSYFNQAIAKDPGYALAYAGLADAYAVLPEYGANPSEDIPKSKAAARKAIELDATLARPHVDLGGTMMAHDWDFAGGEAEFKKALELDPNDAHAHERYADNLGVLGGREQEALAEINRAHQLDPLSPDISVEVGIIYIDARRFDEAIVVCKRVADEYPTFATAHTCLVSAYWGKHMYPQVIEQQKAYGRLSGDRDSSEYASAMENGFRSGGWQGALRKGIETLLTQRKAGYSPPYYIATLYAELGDKEQAFEWLNTTYQEHGELLMCLKTDFMLDSLRSDPRFAELVRKVGLPQ